LNRVLILNGPPRSGKDTLSSLLFRSGMFQNLTRGSFKRPLQDIAAAVLGMSLEKFMLDYEKIKDLPCENGFPMTVRELMIKISEDWIKPIAGKRYFGDLELKRVSAAEEFKSNYFGTDHNPYAVKVAGTTVVYTDGGFGEEVLPFIESLGPENVHIVRIHRKGHTFDMDSRTYLYPEAIPTLKGCKFYDIHNDGTELEFLNRFMDVVFFPLFKESKRD